MEGGVCADLDLAEKEEKGLEERQPPILLVLYTRSEGWGDVCVSWGAVVTPTRVRVSWAR